MGLLSTTEVMDCSVTDLIAPGQGQTGLKVQNLLESALGKVLFIDEAYRLGQRDLTGAFEVVRLFHRLGKTEAWANARDVENLSKRIINLVFMKELHVGDMLAVRMEEIIIVLRQLLQERRPKDQMDNSAETSDSS